MRRDRRTRETDFLCCCEYFDGRGERNHLLACCCNCQELDTCCERLVTCQRIPKNLLLRIASIVMDRIRIPWRGGAVQISLDCLAPIFLLPSFIIVAAHGPWMTVIVLTFLPIFLLYAHFLFMKLKPANHFFVSWTVTSTGLLFLTMRSVTLTLDIRSDEYYSLMALTIAVFCTLYKVKQREPLCFVTEDQMLDGGEKCSECDILLPPRAFHCTSCNTCILKRDQHCAWLNCCIGQYNHYWYMMFLIASLCQMGLCAYLILTTACHPYRVFGDIYVPDDCSDVYYDMVFALTFVTSMYCLEGFVFVASMLVFQCWLISLGITGHEFRNRSKRAFCCGLVMSRPYSKGFTRNWLLFWKGVDPSYQLYKI